MLRKFSLLFLLLTFVFTLTSSAASPDFVKKLTEIGNSLIDILYNVSWIIIIILCLVNILKELPKRDLHKIVEVLIFYGFTLGIIYIVVPFFTMIRGALR